MPRFLKNITIFAIPVLIFLFGLEIYMRSMPNEYRYKAQWMEQHADSVETLILGSSKAYYGFRPDCFSSPTFNLATISGRPDYDYYVLEKYIDKTPQLKTVIYPVFYEIFFDPPFEDCVEWPRATYYKLYWDCPRHNFFSKYNLEISSLFAVKTKLDEFKTFNGETCDSLGYGLQMTTKYLDNKNLSSMEELLHTLKRHTAKDFTYEHFNYGYVEKIAKLCQQKKVRLLLVSTPCMKEYIDLCDKKQYERFKALTKKLIADYNLDYYDFTNSSAFTKDDFFDSNHLNENGAKKLSSMIDTI